jgi:hypothetical protein
MSNQSLITTIPENTSFLQSAKFSFLFPELPFLRYFCQSVTLPGVSTTPVGVENPFSRTYRHGDKLNYDSISITCIVDEDMRVWEETYNWLVALTFPKTFEEYVRFYNKQKSPYHEGILTVNTNANTPNLRIKFLNCHPISISGINFDTKVDAGFTITTDISFRYDTFEITRLNS